MSKFIRLDGNKSGPLAERLEAFLSERVVGQERAVKDLAAAAEFFEAGCRDAEAPIYVGMLAGPSGVGKTLTAEALAEFFFQDPRAFTKIDCSNYQHEGDSNSLIGSAPGYRDSYDPENPDSGLAPLLDQWNMDKHDFYRRQRQSGNASAKEKEKKIQILTFRKRSLLNILMVLSQNAAKKMAELQNEAFNLEKEHQEQVLRQLTKDLVEALVYLCRLKGKEGEQIAKAAQKRRSSRSATVRAKNKAMDLLLKHAEMIEKTEPTAVKILEKLVAIDDELNQLTRENQVGYSPDGNYLSVVLFDEIEKAHPSLHNLLLEVSDKGRLVLRNGAVTRFNNSIILLTSNAGSSVIERILRQSGIGFKSDPVKAEKSETAPGKAIYDEVMREIKKIFSPPFLGRLDNVIVFNPLAQEDYVKIFDLQLGKIFDLLVKDWKFPIILKVDQAIRDYIIGEAMRYPEQGARMIKKKIRKYVMTPLVQMKNNQEIREGDAVRAQLETAGEEPNAVLQRLPREGEEGHENSSLIS